MLQHCLLQNIRSQPLCSNKPSTLSKVTWMSDADSSNLLGSFYLLHLAAHGIVKIVIHVNDLLSHFLVLKKACGGGHTVSKVLM